MRALAALLFALASAIAFAQNANQDAKQLAQSLGRERSVEGLETIAKARNRELLEWYDRGYRETWMKDRRAPHPPGIEAPLRAWLADTKTGPEERRAVESFLAVLTAPPPPPLTPEQQAQAKRAAIAERMREADRLRATDPKGYVAAMETVLAEAGEVADKQDAQSLGMAWLHLGNFTRFRLRDPRRALEIYAKAERAGMDLAIFAQGDTWQFDLRDKARAIEAYRRNGDALRKAVREHGGERAFTEFAQRWLKHQVAYLESGRTFSGEIDRDDIAGAGVMVMFGAGDIDLQAAGLFPPGKLEDMAPSTWSLISGSSKLGSLPNGARVLAFLARNDPAGYASACLFGIVDLSERNAQANRTPNPMFAGSQSMREAKTRFLRERKITLQPLPLQR